MRPTPQGPARRPRVHHIPPEEEICGFYHRHPIVFLRGLRWPVFFFILLALSLLGLSLVNPVDQAEWVIGVLSVGTIILLVGIALAFVWMVYAWIDWRADYFMITARRLIVNVETPGLRKSLREVPMGKVESVVTHHAHFDQVLNKAFGVAELVVDTAGLGRIEFKDIREHDAEDALTILLDVQKGVRAASQAPRQDYMHSVMDSIVHGTPPPPQPLSMQPTPSPREGYGTFNRLFPRRVQREGLQAIWHRHWLFLLWAEMVPVVIVVLFELTNLALTLVLSFLNLATDNPVLAVLAVIRPILYLLLLPLVLWQWDDWRNDQYILDADRIISLDRRPLGFGETKKEAPLNRVSDASVKIEGVVATLLHFGDVVIKTPSVTEEFFFNDVPNPLEVHQEIMNRIEGEREKQQAQVDRNIQDAFRAYVDVRRAEPVPEPPKHQEPWWF
ncbi:MAG TPA: PH domain-containing protein [Chloroflexia bacterium]|nr:PH domain-containing protein [Chloroflexia bacterium]